MSDPTEIVLDGKRYRLVPVEEQQDRQQEEKWREPRMPDDYGRDIQVRDGPLENWVPAKLHGFCTDAENVSWIDEDGSFWQVARIRDDGRKPREVWVGAYIEGSPYGVANPTKEEAYSCIQGSPGAKVIHFREVMEPAGVQQQETA